MMLFVLQNAYTSKKHPFENEDEWHRELLRSHTGRRLKEMIPNGAEYRVVNSSPAIGDSPNSVFPADLTYIAEKIKEFQPDVIVACGRVAQEGCCKLKLKHVSVPHPAWRQLSKIETSRIRLRLDSY